MTLRLTLVLGLFIFTITQSFAQTNNLDIVKEYYPLIYQDIENRMQQRWDKDENQKEFMEEEAEAFIEIAEHQKDIDGEAMTQALLSASNPGYRDENKRIIDDESISNPYPLLKCDWGLVRILYKNTKSNSYDYTSLNTQNRSVEKKNYTDAIYTSQEGKKEKIKEDLTDKKFYQFGIGLGGGFSNIAGLDEWSNNGNPGQIYEARLWWRTPYSNLFWGMGGVSTEYIKHTIKDYYNKSNIDQHYLSTFLMYGIYKHLSPSTTILFGLGGFLSINLSTDSSAYDYDKSEIHPNSNDLEIFNYGLSGLLALQWKRFEFGLHPNLGLADIGRDEYDFKTQTISLTVSYLF